MGPEIQKKPNCHLLVVFILDILWGHEFWGYLLSPNLHANSVFEEQVYLILISAGVTLQHIEYKRKFLFYYWLCDSFFRFLVLSSGGTLIS